jgi:hypothetical protein
MMNQPTEQPDGKAAAALLAAGIGCFILGLATSLSEGIHAVENALNFYNPVGALSGKTSIAILAWLVSWAILASMWKNRPIDVGKVLKATYILIALGLVGTCPLFFNLL